MELLAKFEANNESETRAFAGCLANVLVAGDLIALYGQLGAGKSVVARSVIRAFAGDPNLEVPSPTFAILQEYECSSVTISHFDLYRLSCVSELNEISLYDVHEENLVLIEWPNIACDILRRERLEIWIETVENEYNLRIISINGVYGMWGKRIADALLSFKLLAC